MAASRRSPSIARSRASSSTNLPRATFTSTAPGFMADRKPSSTRFSVSGVAGAASTTTSASGRASGISAGEIMASTGSSPVGWRRTPVTWASNARARWAVSAPMAPSPMISQRDRHNSRKLWCSHRPSAWAIRQRSASWNTSSTARSTNSAMGMAVRWALHNRAPRFNRRS